MCLPVATLISFLLFQQRKYPTSIPRPIPLDLSRNLFIILELLCFLSSITWLLITETNISIFHIKQTWKVNKHKYPTFPQISTSFGVNFLQNFLSPILKLILVSVYLIKFLSHNPPKSVFFKVSMLSNTMVTFCLHLSVHLILLSWIWLTSRFFVINLPLWLTFVCPPFSEAILSQPLLQTIILHDLEKLRFHE